MMKLLAILWNWCFGTQVWQPPSDIHWAFAYRAPAWQFFPGIFVLVLVLLLLLARSETEISVHVGSFLLIIVWGLRAVYRWCELASLRVVGFDGQFFVIHANAKKRYFEDARLSLRTPTLVALDLHTGKRFFSSPLTVLVCRESMPHGDFEALQRFVSLGQPV